MRQRLRRIDPELQPFAGVEVLALVSTTALAVVVAGLLAPTMASRPEGMADDLSPQLESLPAGTVESLLKPENKAKLTAILTYHVVAGKVTAADVVKLKSADTVNGKAVKITAGHHGVKVNDANVTATDIKASNGVIHVIDTVLIP